MTVIRAVQMVVPDEDWMRAGRIAERVSARLGRDVPIAQVSNALAKLWRRGVVERRRARPDWSAHEYRRAA